MTTLTVVLTHLDAATADEEIARLGAMDPRARLAVCHGGTQEAFDAMTFGRRARVDDPTLGGPARTLQSYDVTFRVIYERWVREDPEVGAVYLVEYDHLILRPGFTDALDALAARTGAGLLGKDASRRDHTNWEHYGRFRDDAALRAALRAVSVRDDPTAIFGVLGNGVWLSRAALADYVAVAAHPPCYGELYVPTLLHHLGHRVVDVGAHSDLYDHVRWDPPYAASEVEALRAAGEMFVHPVKDAAVRRAAQSTNVPVTPRG